MSQRIIYTIGTSNREPGEFIEVLQAYRIQLLADVRRFPSSRFDYFKKDNLDKLCRENQIDYCWMGDQLGGYRKGGYDAFLQTETFLNGLSRLEALASSQTTAFCCAERFPWKCHRRFIAGVLQNKGWEVIHILDRNKTWKPEKLELFKNDINQ
ncbi:MAG: DUF488 domain-containing protein [Calditrichia bacterium]